MSAQAEFEHRTEAGLSSERVTAWSGTAENVTERVGWMPAAFLLSGFAALVYQVVWQRALFALFGINIESVTVVVTAFMLGLGVGGVIGGALSRAPDRPLLLYFALAEIGIGMFGLGSLHLFAWVGRIALHLHGVWVPLTMLALLLVPTMLMGATLPLLVGHAVRAAGSVGRSVSTLYFVNTLGAALGAVATATILMRVLGQQRSVLLAVAVNVAAGLLVMWQHARVSGAR